MSLLLFMLEKQRCCPKLHPDPPSVHTKNIQSWCNMQGTLAASAQQTQQTWQTVCGGGGEGLWVLWCDGRETTVWERTRDRERQEKYKHLELDIYIFVASSWITVHLKTTPTCLHTRDHSQPQLPHCTPLWVELIRCNGLTNEGTRRGTMWIQGWCNSI